MDFTSKKKVVLFKCISAVIIIIMGLSMFIIIPVLKQYAYFTIVNRRYIDLGNNYYFDPRSESILQNVGYSLPWEKELSDNEKTVVPSFVEEYKSDGEYIVAKQCTNGLILEWNPICNAYDYLPGMDTTCYWIINKEHRDVLGPFDYDDFLTKLDKRHISLTLN